MDFIVDGLANGRMVRILSVVDAYTRECLALEADTSLGSGSRDAGAGAADRRAWPAGEPALGQRTGVHLAAHAGLGGRTARSGWSTSSPGRPMQNGHVESFHGRLRDECLNASWFRTLNDVRRTLDNWRQEYNCERPHSSLDIQNTGGVQQSPGLWRCGKQRTLPTSPQPRLRRRRDILAHKPKPRNSSYQWLRKTGQVRSKATTKTLRSFFTSFTNIPA